MGWYDHIGSANGNGGGGGLGPGRYRLLNLVTKEHPGEAGGVYFILEYKVLASTNPAHPPESTGAQVIRLDVKFPKQPLGDIKGALAAHLGIDPANEVNRMNTEITPQVVEGAKHPGQPLRGHVVDAEIWAKPPSKPGGDPFNKWKYTPVLGPDGRPQRMDLPPVQMPQTAAPPPGPGGWPGPAAPTSFPPAGPGFGQPAAPPPAPAAPSPFPPPGWTAHPTSPGFFYQGQVVKSEADLRAMATPAPAAGPVTTSWPPSAPAAPPPAQAPFPPAGWTAHPTSPGYFYKGTAVLSEADLRAAAAVGRA